MKTTFGVEVEIDWADLDLFGHVNNVIFFKYIQTARVKFCESVGLSSLNDSGTLSFMLASSSCQYKKPLYYPNKISITVKTDWIKNTSFQLSYTLCNQEGDLIAEAQDVLVVFNHNKKEKEIINSGLREKLEGFKKEK